MQRNLPLLGVLACAASLCHVAPASALPVTDWQAQVTSIFDTDSVRFDPGVGAPVITTSELSWSDPHGATSALKLGAPSGQSGNFAAPASAVVGTPGFSLTHVNSTVDYEVTPMLRSGAVKSTVELHSASDPSVTASTSFNLLFRFLETENIGTDGVCHDGNAPPVGGCADLFVADVDDLQEVFSHAGEAYRASFNMIGGAFVPLASGECVAVGAQHGCVGFATSESGTTTLDFDFELAAVPLPPALLLLPSALLAVAWRRRRIAT